MTKYWMITLLFAIPVFAEYRDITNSTGQVIRAKVLSYQDGFVELERSDRKLFKIPLSSLADEEIERIQSEFSKEAEEAADDEKANAELEMLREELRKEYPIDLKMSKTEAAEAYRQGYNNQKNKDFERAVKIWASIPPKREQYADSRRRAGYNVLGRELGRWDEAIVFLLDAYEEDPKNRDVLEDLGRAYLRVDDYKNARLYLEKARTKTAKEALKELEEMLSEE